MPNKMERFTQRARRVLSLAQEEAERLQHNAIGTEHVLIGLMLEGEGVAGQVLRDHLGLEVRRVQELIEQLTQTAKREGSRSLDLSPSTKKLLEHAVDEARRLGHHYIGTEHLLLGLVRQSEGVALDVLKRLGVSPEEVRRQTRLVLQEKPAQDAPEEPSEEEALQASIDRPGTQPSFPRERMKILEMIEAGRLGAGEAERLLLALQGTPAFPVGSLPLPLRAILSAIFHQAGTQKRQIHVVITDKTTGAVKLDVRLSLSQIEPGFSGIIESAVLGKTGSVFSVDDETGGHIDVTIEDKPE